MTCLNILRPLTVFLLPCNNSRVIYTNKLCFFRNVVCVIEMEKRAPKFKPKDIKLKDMKMHYDYLRTTCLQKFP